MILIFLLFWPEKATRGNSAAEKLITSINLMLLTKCSMLTVKNDDKRKIAFFYHFWQSKNVFYDDFIYILSQPSSPKFKK